MYGIAHGGESVAPVYAAARSICRCWVPMTTLGQAVRSGDEGKQYDLGDDTNAHSWAVLIPTSAVWLASQQRKECPESVSLDAKIMLNPWKVGLPVLVVDGTSPKELYPRGWSEPSRRARTQAMKALDNAHRFVTVMRPMDPKFHRICRSGYTPYGLVSAQDATRRVFEIYWYSLVDAATVDMFNTGVIAYINHGPKEKGLERVESVKPYLQQAAQALVALGKARSWKDAVTSLTSRVNKAYASAVAGAVHEQKPPADGVYLRYGTPTVDIFRMPHANPIGFCHDQPPLYKDLAPGCANLTPSGRTPWIAATMSVGMEELATLRVALAEMHPVRPSPAADDETGAQLANVVQPLMQYASQKPLASAISPWAAPPRTMTVRYADLNARNVASMAATLRSLKDTRVHVMTRCFWGGEPQLWMVD